MKISVQHRQWTTMAGIAVLVTVCMVIYSEQSFNAAVAGLKIWWEVVFPALLPFFILCELLMGLGVVHAMGVLLEPLMRPLFRVPGTGAFAFAMGLASGYPIGAKIVGEMRRKRMCSKVEAERLVSFTNTADPLFMIGAVAVGMFHNPAIGVAIAGAHYVSSVLLGIIMRFYKRSEDPVRDEAKPEKKGGIFYRSMESLFAAREEDGRSIGELLGDSVKESINTLLLIGGYIILFSVLTKILTEVGVVAVLTKIIAAILSPLGVAESLVMPIIGGLFEITNGASLAAKAAAPLFQRVMICSAIIAWSGFSVHAQVSTMVRGTDIRVGAYIIARGLHGVLAALCTFLFLSPSQSVWAPLAKLTPFLNQSIFTMGFFERFGYLFHNLAVILGMMMLLSVVMIGIQKLVAMTKAQN